MSDSHAEHIREHIKVYRNIFIASLILTVVTVTVTYIQFGYLASIILGLVGDPRDFDLFAGHHAVRGVRDRRYRPGSAIVTESSKG